MLTFGTPAWGIILRTVVIYLVLLIGLRLAGKREEAVAEFSEAARLDPFSYTIAINAAEAEKRGLADGALVWVESETGRRVKGRLKLTEGIHPEGVGIAAMCGHWSDGMPVAKGKGVFFNDLLDIDWEHIAPTNNNLDLCVKVRVLPAEDVS